LDAGIRDVFQFNIETDRFVGELRRLGADVKTFNAFEELPGSGATFDIADVAWSALPSNVFVRYGHPGATQMEINDGDGGHIGDLITLYARITGAFQFISTRLQDGDREPTSAESNGITES